MQGTLLQERFKLLHPIGRGGQAVTWLATDTQTEGRVVVKHLSLGKVEQWRHIERFEREGELLASLDHRQIPDYVSAFAQTEGGEASFYLVQEHIQGHTLAEELSSKGRWGDQEAFDDLKSLLELLVWLQRRAPPIFHRDLKPSNIMRREEDGQLVVIDFGAAQLASSDASLTSASLGTAAYMPFEQMSGRAVPATDVYSLGVTMCHLLTGISPDKVDFDGELLGYPGLLRTHGVTSSRLLAVLEGMIQLSLNKRFLNAQQALDALLAKDAQSPPVGLLPSDVPGEVPLRLLRGQARAQTLRRLLEQAGPNLSKRWTRHMSLEPVPLESIERAAMVMARHLGFVMCERVRLFGFPVHETLALLRSADGVVHLVEGSEGVSVARPWHMVTIFEDGAKVITSKASHGSFDGHTRHLVATGDLERDLREHLLVVSAFAKDRKVAIVPDLSLEQLLHLYDDLREHTQLLSRVLLTIFTAGIPIFWGLSVFMVVYMFTLRQRILAPASSPAQLEAHEVVFSLDDTSIDEPAIAPAQVLEEAPHERS